MKGTRKGTGKGDKRGTSAATGEVPADRLGTDAEAEPAMEIEIDIEHDDADQGLRVADNKRGVERVPVPGEVHGEVTVFQPMTILDMSERGAQIETTFALHLDSLHDFRLTLGERSVIVKGRIVHCQIGDIGGGGVHYRTGLEFVEPSEHAVLAIRAFVDAQRAAIEQPPPDVIDAEVAGE